MSDFRKDPFNMLRESLHTHVAQLVVIWISDLTSMETHWSGHNISRRLFFLRPKLNQKNGLKFIFCFLSNSAWKKLMICT